MNVLFIDQFSELGGAQQCLLDLLPAVEKQGWRAHALLPGDGPLIRRLQAAGVDLVKSIRGCPYDLVYVNGPRVLPRAVLSVRRRAPLLFHAHSYLDRALAAWLVGRSLRYSRAGVIAVSRFVAEPLARYVPAHRLHIVPNGTADMGFRRRTFETPLRIGILGRLSPEKGQAEFLRAAALIHGASFVVCGASAWSDPAYARELNRLAHGLPVAFLGWRDDIATVLHGLDLLLIPSRNEGMSRVLAEAFSAGVPVVAFPARAVSDLIDDGETGFLTAGCTPEALAACVLHVAADPARLQKVAHNARAQWERHYQIRAYRERVVELMRQAVTGTARPPQYTEAPPLSVSADIRTG